MTCPLLHQQNNKPQHKTPFYTRRNSPVLSAFVLYGSCSNNLRVQPCSRGGSISVTSHPKAVPACPGLGCHPPSCFYFWTGLRTGTFEVLCWPLCTRAGEWITEPWETPQPQNVPQRLSCTFIALLTWGHLPGLCREHLRAHPRTSTWHSQTQSWVAAQVSPSSHTSVWRCPRLWGIQSFPSKPHSYLQQLSQPKWHCT